MKERLVWAEIDLGKFQKNYLAIKNIVGNTVKIMAVVKANAYGHGLIRVAKEAEALGANYLGVACLYEGRLLREAGIKLPILLLGYTDTENVPSAIQHDLTITIVDELILEAVMREAEKQRKKVKVHVNIDTGIRLHGCMPNDAIPLTTKASQSSSLLLEGIFSHFATAGDDPSFAIKQLETFKTILATLKDMSITLPLIHMANSAATATIPQSHFNMVRIGTFLYGPRTGGQIENFIPESVFSLKTIVSQIRQIQKGESIGYGKTILAKRKTIIASLPVGFADGYRKSPNFGYVLLKGKKAPLITVSMDLSAIDITDIPNVNVEDEVVLLGAQEKERILITDIASKLHATNYEILSNIAQRVPRIYTS